MESVISRTIGEWICRTIVHHYDFVIRIVDPPQVTEALCKPFVACVVCAHDHRDPRQVRVGGKGKLGEDSSHDGEGELWASVTSREPNIPAQPPSKALRTCHSREAAWACSPFRRLSNPISANSNGRLPARVCKRAR